MAEANQEVSQLCAYVPCKCCVAAGELFCSDICAMLGAALVNRVAVSSFIPLKADTQIVPRCACGHDRCGDNLVSGEIH